MKQNYTPPEANDSGRARHPISLYMILVVDVILIVAVIYVAVKAIL